MAGAEKRAQSPVEAAVVRRLRGERAAQRVTVTALAQEVGLSREQLSRILNGSKPASFTEMVDIAAALGVDLAAVVAQAQADLARGEKPTPELRRHPEVPLAAEAAAIEVQAAIEAERSRLDNEVTNDG